MSGVVLVRWFCARAGWALVAGASVFGAFVGWVGLQTVKETALYPQFTWLFVPGLDRGDTKKQKWEANLRNGAMDNFGEVRVPRV